LKSWPIWKMRHRIRNLEPCSRLPALTIRVNKVCENQQTRSFCQQVMGPVSGLMQCHGSKKSCARTNRVTVDDPLPKMRLTNAPEMATAESHLPAEFAPRPIHRAQDSHQSNRMARRADWRSNWQSPPPAHHHQLS